MRLEGVPEEVLSGQLVAEPAQTGQGRRPADRLGDPPAGLLDRVRLLEEIEADLRFQMGALDGR